MAIDTREELINALAEAAEIEHGLLIQYLFAALCMKKRPDEGLAPQQLAACRQWQGVIFGVAVEEMGHLGTVCNLHSAIGVDPHFSRPNFPQQTGYYPFPFDLVPFSDEALYRFQVFELPRGAPLPPPPGADLDAPPPELALAEAVAPEPVTFRYVGELYAEIADAFRTLPERELFIGPRSSQATDDWSVALDLRTVNDRGQALAAIQDIIEDGEGTPDTQGSSHFGRFSAIRRAFFELGRFPAAREVVRNPLTRQHRDAPAGDSVIENEATRSVAELFNIVYAAVLQMLLQYFSYGGETAEQREAIKAALSRLMSVAIRPVAEILTELPYAEATDPRRAGPGFELYGPIIASPFPDARWTLLLERFDQVTRHAAELATVAPRLAPIAETVGFVRRSLALAAGSGGREP
jgi:hypothetical protein